MFASLPGVFGENARIRTLLELALATMASTVTKKDGSAKEVKKETGLAIKFKKVGCIKRTADGANGRCHSRRELSHLAF